MLMGQIVPKTHSCLKCLKICSSFCSQMAYRDRLKDIRATLEVSPFFKCHEVGIRLVSLWAERWALCGHYDLRAHLLGL